MSKQLTYLELSVEPCMPVPFTIVDGTYQTIDARFLENKYSNGEHHILDTTQIEGNIVHCKYVICGPTTVLKSMNTSDKDPRRYVQFLLRSAGRSPSGKWNALSSCKLPTNTIVTMRLQVKKLNPSLAVHEELFCAIEVQNEHFNIIKSVLTGQRDFSRTMAEAFVKAYVAYRDNRLNDAEDTRGFQILARGSHKKLYNVL